MNDTTPHIVIPAKAGIQNPLCDLRALCSESGSGRTNPRASRAASPYQMLHPPSTIRLCPVIHDPAGEASSATAPFKSSGIPERWSAFA